MKKIVLFVICAFFIVTLTACNIGLGVPNKITIDDITYRNGFYGDLWPQNLTYGSGSYKVGSKEFHRVKCKKFDWVHSAIGDTTNGVLYCDESQWEKAHAYYADSENFVYYCKISAQYGKDPVITTISDIDPKKFDELMKFADKNGYNPFGLNKKVKTRSLPIPDKDKSPELTFYKESKDGFFTSYQGSTFHIVDDKLLLLYYYDYGHGKYEKMVAVNVPYELGQYFIKLLEKLKN